MVIVWDERKRENNLAKHGMDFADRTEEFSLSSHVVAAKNGRPKAMGRFADGTIAVVFALLGTEGISVISMRPASKKERSLP